MIHLYCRRETGVITLKSRYSNMYIPSDFFNASFPWVDAFPPHRPFPLGRPCNFQVMHKEVEPIVPNVAVLEPSDADHLFSAKARDFGVLWSQAMFRRLMLSCWVVCLACYVVSGTCI